MVLGGKASHYGKHFTVHSVMSANSKEIALCTSLPPSLHNPAPYHITLAEVAGWSWRKLEDGRCTGRVLGWAESAQHAPIRVELQGGAWGAASGSLHLCVSDLFVFGVWHPWPVCVCVSFCFSTWLLQLPRRLCKGPTFPSTLLCLQQPSPSK